MTAHELKELRRKHRLTQVVLAERLGVIPLTVARWEQGRRKITVPMERLIRSVLRDEQK